jgi:two-component system chemotaxis sensor kinase CheA
MDQKDIELLAKLRGMFKIEADEHLQAIVNGLLALEKGVGAEEETVLLETLYREVHTLKGAARAVNLGEIEGICQVVESVCAPLKRKELAVWPELFDTLHRAMDMVRQLSEAPGEVVPAQLAELMEELGGLEAQGRARATGVLSKEPLVALEEPGIADSAESPLLVVTPTSDTVPPSLPFAEHPIEQSAQDVNEQPPLTEQVMVAPQEETASPQEKERAEAAKPATPVTAQPPGRRRRAAVSRASTRAAARVAKDQPARAETREVAPPEGTTSPEEKERARAAQPAIPVASQTPTTMITPLPPLDRPMQAGPPVTQAQSAPAETVRIATSKLDSLFLQAEEMLAVKLKTGQHAGELRELVALLGTWKREWAKVHTEIRKTQRILEKEENRNAPDPIYSQAAKLVEFLDWTSDHLKALHKALNTVTRGVAQDQQSLGSMVDILLEDAKQVLMLPFSSALGVLPKMVRDLSRAQGKDVELVLQGSEVEIDKRILEEMKDPLIHLLRNCIDHGIERPAERAQQHKPERGTISVAISSGEGNMVEMVIADDGAGIDLVKVREAAVKCGVLSQKAADALTDQEAVSLIFQSEVSTSPVVSNISGRGLGMAIVREKAEKLGGQISVETHRHRGTIFRIRLPLTLATFRGILVQAADQVFVIPTVNVERVVRVKHDEIRTVENRETITLNGSAVALMRLDQALGVAKKARNAGSSRYLPALVLGAAEKRIAFGVDAVLNEQEVLFKSLGRQLSRVRNVAGATVLGSGQVVPVLNVADLLTSAASGAVTRVKAPVAVAQEETGKKSVLVAEDSITSRMLLKEILESAGYQVSTAIDGVDAFAVLQKAHFDLVVSDVEMPRMNGFDLTAKIRSDEKHAKVPVVLVTGLESRVDRERGVDVGASAYVVKGSFDQSNLLETIRRLI